MLKVQFVKYGQKEDKYQQNIYRHSIVEAMSKIGMYCVVELSTEVGMLTSMFKQMH